MKAITFILFLLCTSSAYAANVHVGIRYSFETAHSTIPASERAAVFELADLIEKVDVKDLLISGHTDWIASDEINQELSEGRAFNTRLIVLTRLKNVNINIKGFGKKAPIGDNNTEEGRAKNRRVVASFIEMNRDQKDFILNYVERSKYLYIIEVENEQVEEEIIKVQEPEPEQEIIPEPEPVIEEPEKIAEPIQEAIIPVQPQKEIIVEPATQFLNRYSVGLNVNQSYVVADDIMGSGSGVSAEWVSKLNTGIKAAYQKQLSDRVWFGAQIGFDLQSYYDQSNPMFTWDKETPMTSNVSIVTDYETKYWGLGLNLDFYEDIILREETLNLSFDKVLIYGLTVESKYYFLNSDFSNLGLGLDVILPLASSENFGGMSNVGFNAALLFKTKHLSINENHEWFIKLYYRQTNYSVNDSHQKNSSAGIEFTLRNLNWL